MRSFLWSLPLVLALLRPALAAEVRLEGRVIDENKVAVAGAVVVLQDRGSAESDIPVSRAVTGISGSFVLTAPVAGAYRLKVHREGYFLLEEPSVALEGGANEITVTVSHLREVHESVDVAYSPPAIEFEKTSAEESVTGNDILFVPYPSSHSFRNALRILPGAVVQDRLGETHINGGAANQMYWTLDGFNVTDPLSGRFGGNLSVEAVRSVTLSSSRYSAEFGKGSAGVLAVDSSMGDDQFRASATNFVPGVETRKGLTLGDWRPRVNLSGPLVRGRSWFFNSLSAQYNKHIVEELPKGEDRTTSYRLSNLLRGQVNLTPSNVLHGGVLINMLNAPRSGLGVLDPTETTVDIRSRQYFLYLKDQMYFRRGLLLEVGYARNRTFGREIPQGQGMYILTPAGRQGNYFADGRHWARRDQFLSNAILPSFSLAGSHQIKAGIDFNLVEYEQDVRRTGFERRRLNGSPIRRVLFQGNGRFGRSNTEAAWYLQDSWKLRPNLLLEAGVRQDWDRLVSNLATSPRFAFSWSPSRRNDTKISGGYAVLYDATNLQTFSQHLDQHTLTTLFDPRGSILSGPSVSLFTIDRSRHKAPHFHNWSLGIERRLPGDLYGRANYLRRRGRDGFTFVNTLHGDTLELAKQAAVLDGTSFDAIHALRNIRRDEFDSVEITLRKTFRKQYVWLGSYTRSRSVSNAALDISIDNPTLITENLGPTPWDAPHRLMSWGYFPLTKKYGLAYLLEWRSGFPFSVEDEFGQIVGAVHSRRFPDFLELNLHLERRVTLFGHRWALRIGANNLTDRLNPTIVNNNIASPDFLDFAGGTSRAFVTRIRWLGRADGRL